MDKKSQNEEVWRNNDVNEGIKKNRNVREKEK